MCVCLCLLEQENLLDSHEFLRWLVERVDHIKSADTKGLQLYLPLVLKVKGRQIGALAIVPTPLPHYHMISAKRSLQQVSLVVVVAFLLLSVAYG